MFAFFYCSLSVSCQQPAACRLLSLPAPETLQTSLPAASGSANSSRFPAPGPVSLFRFRPPALPALSLPASGSVSLFRFQLPDLSAAFRCRPPARSRHPCLPPPDLPTPPGSRPPVLSVPPGFRPPDLSNCRSGDVKSAKPTCFEAPDLCRTACRNLAESVRFTIQKCAGSCRLSHCSGPNAGPDLANIEKSCKLCNISGGKSEEDFRPKNHTYRHFTPPCAPCGRDARRDRGARPARDADDAPARHILRAWAAGPYAKA